MQKQGTASFHMPVMGPKKKEQKKKDVRGTKSADQRVSERKLCMHRSYASLSGLPLHLDHHWMVVQTVVVRW